MYTYVWIYIYIYTRNYSLAIASASFPPGPFKGPPWALLRAPWAL